MPVSLESGCLMQLSLLSWECNSPNYLILNLPKDQAYLPSKEITIPVCCRPREQRFWSDMKSRAINNQSSSLHYPVILRTFIYICVYIYVYIFVYICIYIHMYVRHESKMLLLSRIRPFVTPACQDWGSAARQASQSFTISWVCSSSCPLSR